MSDTRTVAMSAEQAAEIDRYVNLLMKANRNERASRMMELANAYRFAEPQKPERSSNVIDLHDFSRRVGA